MFTSSLLHVWNPLAQTRSRERRKKKREKEIGQVELARGQEVQSLLQRVKLAAEKQKGKEELNQCPKSTASQQGRMGSKFSALEEMRVASYSKEELNLCLAG